MATRTEPSALANDRALARAAAVGHPVALRAIVERLSDRLGSIAWRLCSDHAECEDLCQEALLKLTSPPVLEAYEGRARLDAYLLQVGVRAMVSSLRGRGVRDWRDTQLMADLSNREWTSDGSEPDEPADSLDPSLREALLKLPARARLIVLIIAIADYSYAEAAELTGLPLGTVKSAYSRARRMLRDALESEPAATGVRVSA